MLTSSERPGLYLEMLTRTSCVYITDLSGFNSMGSELVFPVSSPIGNSPIHLGQSLSCSALLIAHYNLTQLFLKKKDRRSQSHPQYYYIDTRYKNKAKRETLIPLASLAGPLFYLLINPKKIRHIWKLTVSLRLNEAQPVTFFGHDCVSVARNFARSYRSV